MFEQIYKAWYFMTKFWVIIRGVSKGQPKFMDKHLRAFYTFKRRVKDVTVTKTPIASARQINSAPAQCESFQKEPRFSCFLLSIKSNHLLDRRFNSINYKICNNRDIVVLRKLNGSDNYLALFVNRILHH